MFKFIKTTIFPFYAPIRHPFRSVQRVFGIEEEWKQTKALLTPHKYKLFFALGALTFPFYKDWLTRIKVFSYSQVQQELQPGQPLDSIVQSFLKQTVQEVLKDQQIQRESGQFVERLGKQQDVQDTIVNLLKESIQNPLFLKETQEFGKQLTLELLKDKEIERDLLQLVLRIFNDVEVKHEVKELLKWGATQDDVKDGLVQLLKNAGDDPIFRAALGAALQASINDLLMRKETSEKIRMFGYFLLQSESNNDQSVKGLIDLIVQRAMKKKTDTSKEREFDRIMKGLIGKEGVQELDHDKNQQPTQENKKQDIPFY